MPFYRVNPGARRAQAAAHEAPARLRALGLDLVPVISCDPVRVGDIIRRERDGVGRFIVAGGDGALDVFASSRTS